MALQRYLVHKKQIVSLEEVRTMSLPKEHFSTGEWHVPAERRITTAKSKVS